MNVFYSSDFGIATERGFFAFYNIPQACSTSRKIHSRHQGKCCSNSYHIILGHSLRSYWATIRKKLCQVRKPARHRRLTKRKTRTARRLHNSRLVLNEQNRSNLTQLFGTYGGNRLEVLFYSRFQLHGSAPRDGGGCVRSTLSVERCTTGLECGCVRLQNAQHRRSIAPHLSCFRYI